MGTPRPTGEDLGRYKDSEKWTKKRWAWEFLRRNDEFIADCKRLREDNPQIEAAAIAEKFSLVRFKDFTERFWLGRPPRFEPATIWHWSRLGENDRPHHKRRMDVGSLAVVFNLDAALDRPSAIDAQLRAAKKVALQKLQEFAKLRGVGVKDVRVSQTDQWLKFLRILDYKAAKKANRSIAIELYADEVKELIDEKFKKGDIEELVCSPENLKEKLNEKPFSVVCEEFFRHRLRSARSMAKEGYLNVCVSRDRSERKDKMGES